MASNFAAALDSQVIAARAQAQLFVSYPIIQLNDRPIKPDSKTTTTPETLAPTSLDISNQILTDVGNITNESEICYEFTAQGDIGQFPQVYFQLQIRCELIKTNQKMLTVLTIEKPTTNDFDLANKELNIPVLSSNVAQQCARLTQSGQYEKAREKATQIKTLLQPHIKTPWQEALFKIFLTTCDTAILSLKRQEQQESEEMRRLDDDEREKLRSQQRFDGTSNMMYDLKNAKSGACSIQ